MDVRVEAAAVEAKAEMLQASTATQKVESFKAFARIERTASFSCPSIAGHSLSAVAPDYTNFGGTALAAA